MQSKHIQAQLDRDQFVKFSALKNTVDCSWSELVVHALENLYNQKIERGARNLETTNPKQEM